MTNKTLHGQGATPERLEKTKIITGIRSISKGGMPLTYGHIDTEHCALDVLLKRGIIEMDHYQAGYDLRNLYYRCKVSASSALVEGSPGYDGELDTAQDRAYECYREAIKVVSPGNRGLIEHICIYADTITAYGIMNDVIRELENLSKFFKKKCCPRSKIMY